MRLSHALDKAKVHNVPKDVVEGALKRAVDGKDGAVLETIMYEGTGVGGTAFLVECLTDSRNRTAPALRHVFSKHGGALGTSGSTAWQFEARGRVCVEVPAAGDGDAEEQLLEAGLEAGADDVQYDDGDTTAALMCDPASTHALRTALEEAGYAVQSAELTSVPWFVFGSGAAVAVWGCRFTVSCVMRLCGLVPAAGTCQRRLWR